MKYFIMLALLGTCLVGAPNAKAQVAVGVGVGGPGYGAPVCAYGYYGYYPYACAPYGYYGPSWFNGGLFIGAGPWFRGGFGFRPGFGWGRLDSAGDLALADDLDSAAGQELVAGRESAYVDRLAMDSAAVSHAESASTVVAFTAEAVRMLEAVPTVEAVRMGAVTAADTGKIQQ